MSGKQVTLRQSQLVLGFGPGAMVDLPTRSVVIGGLDLWHMRERGSWRPIHEPRAAAVLEALLRMFEQLYDLTGRKLFRGLLFLSGETIAGLSAQNQFRRVEALGGIDSADRWIEIGATRNILVHDYPTNVVARAQRANRAWSDLPVLIAATRQTIATLRAERLIP